MTADKRRIAEGFLFTDMYQLTMAQLYYRKGLHEKPAQFDHFFRNYPDYGTHSAGYCINAGLGWFLEWMQEARVGKAELEVLRAQKGRTGKRLFDEDFLGWLKEESSFERLSLSAIPEGRVVHANVPLTVIEGPLAVAQLLETSLLAQLNYQTLIATKAARIKDIARGGLVLEFGARRAHDRGANAGARAALIGGADFSSNVGISHVLGYAAKGTHAHSMVQVFVALGMGELEAFRAYAETYPDECLLLVDTLDTLNSGIPNAITVFEELRRKGHKPVGIRIDSGDLAYLSIQAARMLNDADFEDTSITLSSDLDELVIWQIVTQIAQEAPRYGLDADSVIKRLVYGVGTRLITSAGDSALGGVYKLVGMQTDGVWQPAIKVSNSPQKTPNPGNKRIYRLYDKRGSAMADVLALETEKVEQADSLTLHHPADATKRRVVQREGLGGVEGLLEPILKEGKLVYDLPDMEGIRRVRDADFERLESGVRRLVNPHIYHVSLTQALWNLKQNLIRSILGDDS